MRTIKFRGQRVDNGEWVYGSYHFCVGEGVMGEWKWGESNRTLDEKPVQFNQHWILVGHTPYDRGWTISDTFTAYSVTPETVGQFTGLQDKNGVDIYEGDVCQIMLRKKYGHQRDNEPATVGAVSFGRVVVNGDTLNAYNAFHINSRSIEYLIGQELQIIGNKYETTNSAKNSI